MTWWEWLGVAVLAWLVLWVPSAFLLVGIGLKGNKVSKSEFLGMMVREWRPALLLVPVMTVIGAIALINAARIGAIALITMPFDLPRTTFERRLSAQLDRLGVSPDWTEDRYRREENALRHGGAPLSRERVIDVLEQLPDNAGAANARKAIADAIAEAERFAGGRRSNPH